MYCLYYKRNSSYSPPAPSTESLALAHLVDSAPASSRTSAASASAALQTLSLEDEEKPARSESGKTQCSSSCSTVVVTPVQTSKFLKLFVTVF